MPGGRPQEQRRKPASTQKDQEGHGDIRGLHPAVPRTRPTIVHYGSSWFLSFTTEVLCLLHVMFIAHVVVMTFEGIFHPKCFTSAQGTVSADTAVGPAHHAPSTTRLGLPPPVLVRLPHPSSRPRGWES